MNTQQTIEEYTKLPINLKKEKLIKLLEIFSPYRKEILETIKFIKNDQISEQDIINTYISCINAMQENQKQWLNKAIDIVANLHQKILKIQNEEQQDRQSEWNPDDLLNQI